MQLHILYSAFMREKHMAGRKAAIRYFIFLKKASCRVYLGVIRDLAQCNTSTATAQAVIYLTLGNIPLIRVETNNI